MEVESPQQGGTTQRGLAADSLTQRGSPKLKIQFDFEVEIIINRPVAKIVEKTARSVLNAKFSAVYREFCCRGFAFYGEFEFNGIGFTLNGHIGSNGIHVRGFFAYGFNDKRRGFEIIGAEEIGGFEMAFEFGFSRTRLIRVC